MKRVPEHDVGSASQSVDHRGERREVVRSVGVRHDDEPAARRREAREVGAAVAATGLVYDDRARGSRDVRRPVLGAVVDDDHLPRDAEGGDRREGILDDSLNGVLFVQTGDHERHLRRLRVARLGRGHVGRAVVDARSNAHRRRG